jgi:glycosyltransferase involved in cell wall biosynthesis
MKIVHLIGFFQPEFGYQEYYLAKKQVEMGNEVYIITSDLIYPLQNIKKLLENIKSPYRTRKRPVGQEILDGIIVIRLPHIFTYRDAIVIKNITEVLAKIRPDIVHAHELRQITPAFSILSKFLGYKLVIDQHDFELSKTILGKIDYFLIRWIFIQIGLLKADAIIAVFKAAEIFLRKNHYLNHKPIYIVPNGSETDIYKFNPQKRVEIRKKLCINDDEILLIFAGQISQEKALHNQIYALKTLIRENYKCKLLIIGSGDTTYIEKLKAFGNKLNMQESLFFLDFMPQKILSDYFSAADIGVFFSRPTIIMQEMIACKLALLIPENAATAGLIAFKNGRSFKRGDLKDFIKQLKNIISNNKELEKMRENSLKAVKNYFSWTSIAKRVQKIYEHVLKY